MHGLDGVVTDDPKRFLEVCEEWERGERVVRISMGQWVHVLWIHLMVLVFGIVFWWKYGRDGAGGVDGTGPRRRRTRARARQEVALPVGPVQEKEMMGRR